VSEIIYLCYLSQLGYVLPNKPPLFKEVLVDGEKKLRLDTFGYYSLFSPEEMYAHKIGREFGLSPYVILETWSYEEIYKTISFLEISDEEAEEKYKKSMKRRR